MVSSNYYLILNCCSSNVKKNIKIFKITIWNNWAGLAMITHIIYRDLSYTSKNCSLYMKKTYSLSFMLF